MPGKESGATSKVAYRKSVLVIGWMDDDHVDHFLGETLTEPKEHRILRAATHKANSSIAVVNGVKEMGGMRTFFRDVVSFVG
jgi:hypothetical protein